MTIKTAILILASTGALTLAAFVPAPEAPTMRDSFEGRITSWTVEGDGTVLLNLETEAGRNCWLRTPPNQSSTTQFELLALHAILSLERTPDQIVRVTGHGSTEHDGSSRFKALDLQAIGR